MEMTHLRFVTAEQQILAAFSGSYNLALVVFSILVAILAAYATFIFSAQAHNKGQSKAQGYGWLLAGVSTLGGGIWGMHFIGMLAYQLPISVSYDPAITALSAIPALMAGLIVLSCNTMSMTRLSLCSLGLGICIGAMHYIGMSAMQLNAEMWYLPLPFLLSLVVAVVFSAIALSIKQWAAEKASRVTSSGATLAASVLMGLAISGMHYTGMAACIFVPTDKAMMIVSATDPMVLALMVGLVIAMLSVLLMTAVFFNGRMKLLNQLQASQLRMQKIFDSTADAMLVINGSGNINSLNSSAEKIFGYPLQGMIGANINMLLYDPLKPDDVSLISRFIDHSEVSINNNAQEVQGKDKQGRKFPIELSINKAVISGVPQFICLIRDVTERKQADIVLRDTMARSAAIIDTVPDGVFTIDEHGIVQTMNPAGEKIFGYYIGEVEGQNISMLMPEPYRSAHNGYLKRYVETEESGLIGKTLEMLGQRKNGVIFPIELSVNEFFLGSQRFFTGVIRDIAARKAAEQEIKQHRDNLQELVAIATTEIKAIVQTAVNGVISIDQNGIVHIFNPAAEKMFGWASTEIVGKNIAMLVPDMDDSTHNGYITRYLNSLEPHIVGTGREVQAQRKDGTIFSAHLAIGHSELAPGNHLFVAYIADITEQKKAEQELLLAKENAEQAARTKANFLANMSHEIRTPMNAVIGFSELVLQDRALSEASRQHVRTILNSGRNLLGIINDILDFTKIEAGKVNIEAVCFNLPNALQDTLSTLELKAAEKDLELRLQLSPDLPTRVIGDPARLRQVILNLVGNAIKFTLAGSITIVVAREQNSERLHFSIADTGIGMRPDQLARVFDAFSQADASTNRRFGGTGLGTTISKQIVELMGGNIWAESVEGQGSTFHFTAYFPASTAADHCLFEDGSFVHENYHSPRAFKVLLAEDIPANATLATLRLQQQGHEVTWVQNGQLAVDAIKEGDYDIVLMDVQMPELDGIAATRMIRQQQVTLPVIALTASVMKEDQQQCFDAGMHAIVGKPINFPELLATMEQWVPAGKGKLIESTPVLLMRQEIIDFSPLAGVVDYESGLNIWQDPLIYAQSLVSFACEHKNSADIMREQLAQSVEGNEPAHALAHALKGLAGNMAIPDVANCAARIDDLLKRGKLEAAERQLPDLSSALARAAEAIEKLVLPEERDDTATQTLDSSVARITLKQLLDALDELNPDAAAPHLKKLGSYLSKVELNPIQRNINDFNFDAAKQEVLNLAKRLNITLAEGL